ncbi:MAG TPA: Holliday junction branch migration protein RuvA [Bacteroidales bacterium]|nr:Holliday junction branch migration protein RuvA [Bacteroidales bacterium]HPR58165.1 Holliday junction branch migration protein RuvA [Bacteroidales bacterium]HRW96823.1 Holliday junction branch migration protein RuvA [Bacteroidales bacterium]
MIEYLKGRLVEKNPAYVILEQNGTGYLINISLQTYSAIKDFEETKLYTHLAFKIEATTPTGLVIYGFYEPAERQLYRMLITVSGVGNNTAMLMLSSLAYQKIIQAIQQGEINVLKGVKGIGNKTAQRIIVELQDKIGKESVAAEFLGIKHNTQKDEALIGLTTLGFGKQAAEKALNTILKNNSNLSVENLIKEALKIL